MGPPTGNWSHAAGLPCPASVMNPCPTATGPPFSVSPNGHLQSANLTPFTDVVGEQANEKQLTTGAAIPGAPAQTCPVTCVFDSGEIAQPLLACGMCCRKL